MTRIVVFGATGYTGRLAVDSLTAAGARPVLAGRNAQRLTAMAEEYDGLETAVADVAHPETVAALVGPGDVLLSTVGPFMRYGTPALEAAITAGAHYVDSTGESGFIRRVFADHGPRAAEAGCALLTAFGYDYVPGNLAGALALRDAGEKATRLDIGYFFTGHADAGSMSSGTRATMAGSLRMPQHALRAARLVEQPAGRRTGSFLVAGKRLRGSSVGTTESLALPRIAPQLRDVDVFLGWFGPATPLVQAGSYLLPALTGLPGVATLVERAAERATRTTGTGPGPAARARQGSRIVARAHDAAGSELVQVVLEGDNGYDLTGRFLAWAAQRLAHGDVSGSGALGPVDAFGLDDLEKAAAGAGLRRVS